MFRTKTSGIKQKHLLTK